MYIVLKDIKQTCKIYPLQYEGIDQYNKKIYIRYRDTLTIMVNNNTVLEHSPCDDLYTIEDIVLEAKKHGINIIV